MAASSSNIHSRRDAGRLVRVHVRGHESAAGTDNDGDNKLHDPAETGVDGAYAARTAHKVYRTMPLRGLWQHPPHLNDGSAATLADVVAHYNQVRRLNLSTDQQRELEEYPQDVVTRHSSANRNTNNPATTHTAACASRARPVNSLSTA